MTVSAPSLQTKATGPRAGRGGPKPAKAGRNGQAKAGRGGKRRRSEHGRQSAENLEKTCLVAEKVAEEARCHELLEVFENFMTASRN